MALVGPSGAGKSTLFKLIAGFYECSEGSIRLFGTPLNEWELPAARSTISLVSQDAFLFPGTIAENITCGRSDFSPADVERAAAMANIHDFIASLPEGYNTQVGERGVNFSGGQRQRISIARAILKDAPILLLDEPTSALDPESEKLIQDALRRALKGKTVLVIAHRLSTVTEADLVLVMDEGRIVERGTHAELMAFDGLYRRLCEKQWIRQAGVLAPEGEGA